MNTMQVLSSLLTSVVIAMIHLPSLVRKKLRKEAAVFVLLLAVGTWLFLEGLALADNLSPLYLIKWLYEPISQWVGRLLPTWGG
ncbi:hypothetical protein [Gorillibacterium sp. CAU 1737]|uniref:hypothetical protein n=1 Tax=Gorillibacterium sp. CAU 1737 TaxID=3140362 RepID=UPI0032606E40